MENNVGVELQGNHKNVLGYMVIIMHELYLLNLFLMQFLFLRVHNIHCKLVSLCLPVCCPSRWETWRQGLQQCQLGEPQPGSEAGRCDQSQAHPLRTADREEGRPRAGVGHSRHDVASISQLQYCNTDICQGSSFQCCGCSLQFWKCCLTPAVSNSSHEMLHS